MKILCAGLRFPEGPVVMPDGSVIVTEIAGQSLVRIQSDGSSAVLAKLGGGPNGAALGPSGKLYVCNNGGVTFRERDGMIRAIGAAPDYDGGRIEVVDPETGKMERLYDRAGENLLAGPPGSGRGKSPGPARSPNCHTPRRWAASTLAGFPAPTASTVWRYPPAAGYASRRS